MHDVMRARLMRKLEALPEEKLYQVLDYIEFLESRHSPEGPSRARGFQRLAERLEDGMRQRRISTRTIGRAMTVVGTAGRVVNTVASAGRQAVRTGRALLEEVESAAAPAESGRDVPAERSAAEGEGGESARARRKRAAAADEASPPSSPGTDAGDSERTVVPIE